MSKTAPWNVPGATEAAVAKATEYLGKPVVFFDFEFNNSQEPVLNLVCTSIIASETLVYDNFRGDENNETDKVPPFKPLELWLHDERGKACLLSLLHNLKFYNSDAVMIAYAAPAEARSLQAAGIDPHLFTWVDLFADWRQLTFNNYVCQYGTYFTATGYERYSVPPHFDAKRNRGKDNKEVGLGLAACVGQLFGVYIDTKHKNEMRDLIISAPEEFTPAEKKSIMDYCTSDILPLPFIFLKQQEILQKLTKLKTDEVITASYNRGRFMVSVAKMETEGFPLDMPAALNLRKNYVKAREEIIEDLVKNHYPFFERRKAPGPKSKGIRGDWVEKYDNFVGFLETVEAKQPGTMKRWPKTNSGKFSTADDVLESYDGIPEIYAYRQARKNIKQIAWFKEPDARKKKTDGDFFDSVGSDGRLRTFLGAYGTQTSRNAPKASRFVLAMSNWLRCLIKPPKGYTIVAIDYASQEFAIAAVMSHDKNMIAAYMSGDPYLYFAKKAGAVPVDANPKECKTPELVLLEAALEADPNLDKGDFFGHGCPAPILETIKVTDRELYKKYVAHKEHARQRDLFKSTTLGLQYGMGAEKLAAKLTADMGELITERDATKLINLHKKTYPVYWKWLEKISTNYDRGGCLILRDGWALLKDNSNSLSVRNFPVQGTGAVIMRKAVDYLHEAGKAILAPLHDALYCICKDEEVETFTEFMAECMLKAVEDILGDLLEIRLDIDHHNHADTWLEGKGKKFYKILSKYLDNMETDQDINNRLINTIFKYEV